MSTTYHLTTIMQLATTPPYMVRFTTMDMAIISTMEGTVTIRTHLTRSMFQHQVEIQSLALLCCFVAADASLEFSLCAENAMALMIKSLLSRIMEGVSKKLSKSKLSKKLWSKKAIWDQLKVMVVSQ